MIKRLNGWLLTYEEMGRIIELLRTSSEFQAFQKGAITNNILAIIEQTPVTMTKQQPSEIPPQQFVRPGNQLPPDQQPRPVRRVANPQPPPVNYAPEPESDIEQGEYAEGQDYDNQQEEPDEEPDQQPIHQQQQPARQQQQFQQRPAATGQVQQYNQQPQRPRGPMPAAPAPGPNNPQVGNTRGGFKDAPEPEEETELEDFTDEDF